MFSAVNKEMVYRREHEKGAFTQRHLFIGNSFAVIGRKIRHQTSNIIKSPQTPTFAAEINLIMATTSDISRGMILKLDGSLYSVVEFGENKTARAAAKVWAKLKGVDNKRSIEKTWNSGENIFPVRVEKKAFQFLYKDESGFNLMNNETFEQIALAEEMIDAPQFLKDGSEVFVYINTETDQPIGAELPEKIVLKITYCEPGLRGDTATRALKAATVETGATVMVPLFVEDGELIRVNTKTGDYVERVKE
jgi:elongation factor P